MLPMHSSHDMDDLTFVEIFMAISFKRMMNKQRYVRFNPVVSHLKRFSMHWMTQRSPRQSGVKSVKSSILRIFGKMFVKKRDLVLIVNDPLNTIYLIILNGFMFDFDLRMLKSLINF